MLVGSEESDLPDRRNGVGKAERKRVSVERVLCGLQLQTSGVRHAGGGGDAKATENICLSRYDHGPESLGHIC